MHELTTPLTAIRGAAEVLQGRGGEHAETRGKFLSNIRLETERMNSIVGELNELTKLDTEARLRSREPVDYGRCITGILERLEPTFPARRPRIVLRLPDDALQVSAVPGRLEQVFANLLDNAIRYTDADGRIEISVERGAGKTVVTTVRDSGCGIAPSNLEKVFDRFFTTEPKGAPNEHGSGLGLAIVKRIIENHKGTIRVESEPGRGAAFVFTLPLVH
jgi:two-component system phosphate regulon sensor histidine kinase PhoR